MELRDLRAFATLGELLHFGQAAERIDGLLANRGDEISRTVGEVADRFGNRPRFGYELFLGLIELKKEHEPYESQNA